MLYMSQPNSRTFSRIIPTTCAPVHRGENPLRTRQCAQFLGRQKHACNRGDVAEEQHARARRDRIIDKIQRRRRIRHGFGSVIFFTTIPYRFARRFQGCSPPGCSWSVISTSSPGLMSSPLAM